MWQSYFVAKSRCGKVNLLCGKVTSSSKVSQTTLDLQAHLTSYAADQDPDTYETEWLLDLQIFVVKLPPVVAVFQPIAAAVRVNK